MKKMLIGTAVLAAVVAVAAVLLVGNLERVIKGALEGVGSDLLGTKVAVAKVELDLKRGTGQISGFSIANPAGYSSGNAFQMDMIKLDLNLNSLHRQPLVINELRMKNPVVRVEAREDGGVNLKTLLDNIERNSARADEKAAEQQPETEEVPEGEPVRISFGRLAIIGVEVHASIPGQEPETVVLPDIVMTDLGKREGLTPAGIGKAVIGEIAGKSMGAVLKRKLTERVGEAVERLLEDLKEKLGPGESK
jgi:hypothetical protein